MSPKISCRKTNRIVKEISPLFSLAKIQKYSKEGAGSHENNHEHFHKPWGTDNIGDTVDAGHETNQQKTKTHTEKKYFDWVTLFLEAAAEV